MRRLLAFATFLAAAVAPSSSADPPPVIYARLSWHVRCYAGDEMVYEGDSTPSMTPALPNVMGGTTGAFAFVDRKRRLLVRSTLPCVATVPFQGALPP